MSNDPDMTVAGPEDVPFQKLRLRAAERARDAIPCWALLSINVETAEQSMVQG
jgi:hypothetical protein